MGAAKREIPAGGQQRSFRGQLVRPRAQLAWCLLLCLGFVVLGSFCAMILAGINNSVEQMRETFQLDTDTANLIMGNVSLYLRAAITMAAVFTAMSLLAGVVLSNRVYGPMVPLLAHVRRLIDGQYDSRVRIRPTDEFKDLAAELNALAEALEQRG